MSKLLHAEKSLENWFQRTRRILPWRDEPTVYRVWISEIMLQQTQVQTVVPFFEQFMSRFPTVESLAQSPLDDVLLQWAGLGYYSRARNLHKAAQIIVERGFPTTREGWLEIPGVGGYTAGAVLSIAQDKPEAILDGNVERVLSRLECVDRKDGDAEFKSKLWKISEEWVRTGHSNGIRPSILNQALMELGALVCTPKKPRCLICPVSEICAARKAGNPEDYPPRKKPKEWISVKENLQCLVRYGSSGAEVLMKLRKKGEWRSGLWDFIEADETPAAKSLGKIKTRHIVTRHKIHRETQVWEVSQKWKAAEPEFRWVSTDQPDVALGSAARKTLDAVKELLKEN